MTGWSLGAIGNLINLIMVPEKIAAIFVFAPTFDMASYVYVYTYQLWGTFTTNLPTNEGYTRNQRLNSCYMLSEKKNSSLPIMYTFCGKNDVGNWTEKIAFYDSMNNCNHGGFHFWSQVDHYGTYIKWMPNFPNFHFLLRYGTNISYPAFSNCSFNDNPGNGSPTNGDSIGSINGYLDWTDNIVDTPELWATTLFVHDLLTTQGTLVAPDSGTTDITLRRLQEFSVPLGETVYWENYKNGVIVQQGSFIYNGNLITIPEVKVYKDSSYLKVFYTPVSVDEDKYFPSHFALEQNYPNPFNPTTTIGFGLRSKSNVRITILNAIGEEVAVVLNEEREAGFHQVVFNAINLPSGVYFYQIQAGSVVETKKMILMK